MYSDTFITQHMPSYSNSSSIIISHRIHNIMCSPAPELPMRAVTVPGSKYPSTPFSRSSSSPLGRDTVYQMSRNANMMGSKGISPFCSSNDLEDVVASRSIVSLTGAFSSLPAEFTAASGSLPDTFA